MLKSKKKKPAERRENIKDRRKPGDRRFPGRLIGIKKRADRINDRRKGNRREGRG
jgi:hypothetical protein